MLQYMLPFPIKIQKPILHPYDESGVLPKQNPKRKILSILLPRF